MKLFKTLALTLGIAALSFTTVGCGDACEAAKSHIEDCGGTTTEDSSDDECTDKDAAVADCFVDLSCDEITNTDFAAELACAAATP